MRRDYLAGLVAIIIGSALYLAALAAEQEPPAAPTVAAKAILPGALPDGFIQLPNQWRLRPAGRHVEVGDFPVNMVLHPGGKFLAVLHAGYRDHEIVVLAIDGSQPRLV